MLDADGQGIAIRHVRDAALEDFGVCDEREEKREAERHFRFADQSSIGLVQSCSATRRSRSISGAIRRPFGSVTVMKFDAPLVPLSAAVASTAAPIRSRAGVPCAWTEPALVLMIVVPDDVTALA